MFKKRHDCVKRVQQFLPCLVLMAPLAVGQSGEKPKDVEGWDKIKWGMTLQEARAAYRSEAPQQATDYWTFQRLESIKIGDIDMDADAMARHGSDRVVRVQLSWIFFRHPEGPSGGSGFDMLRTLLIQKYGPAASDETKKENGSTGRKLLWTFPSTSIALELDQVAVTVDYTASDKKALDAL